MHRIYQLDEFFSYKIKIAKHSAEEMGHEILLLRGHSVAYRVVHHF